MTDDDGGQPSDLNSNNDHAVVNTNDNTGDTDGGNSNIPNANDTQEQDTQQTNMERLLAIMIEENRRRDAEASRRDELLSALVQKLNVNETTPQSNSESSAPNAYQIMPDLNRNIQDFYGDQGATMAKEWIGNLDSMRQLHRWPDGFVLESARIHLRKGAYHWLQPQLSELNTWQKFKDAFMKTFVGKEDQTTKWERMVKRTQQRGEATTAYFYEKVKMCNDLKLPMSETKEQVLIGLWSREPCTSLATNEYTTVDDLFHDVMNIEKLSTRRSDMINSTKGIGSTKTEVKEKIFTNNAASSRTGTTPSSLTSSSSQPDKKNAATATKQDHEKRTPTRNENGEYKCYDCQEYGHLSRDCIRERKELRCLTCNGVGHTRKHCTNTTSNVNEIGSNYANGINKYMKKINIDDHELVAFVDMGSSECTIKTSVATAQSFQINDGTMELRGWGTPPRSTTSPGWIDATIIVDNVKANNIPVRLVPDEAQLVDMIIGRSYTELPHVGYFKRGDELRFYQCDVENPFAKMTLNAGESSVMHVGHETTLYAGTINVIMATEGQGEVNLPVINVTDKEINIRKHEAIGCDMIYVVEAGTNTTDKEGEPYAALTVKDVNVGEEQPREVIQELVELLNEYRDCVAMNLAELGCTDKISMDIVEEPESKPFRMKPYRASAKEREQISTIVKDWKHAEIVTETNSPYASPVLLVPKKTGEARLVVDYRRLNRQTVPMSFPLSNLDDHIEMMSGCTMFTVIDLANGYLQVPLKEEARSKTAFITPDETGEFTRMMFGLVNAPAEFSRLMKKVLGDLMLKKVAMFYLDDIFIPGRNWKDHKMRLKLVFDALRAAKLTVKLSKCEFLKERVVYLGFEITRDGILPGQRKVRAIEDFPRPSNVHEVRRFIGLISFFRRFVVRFAQLAGPLFELLKKDNVFEWTDEHETVFVNMKKKITERPILAIFDSKRETELHTDASAQGLAAMLFQRGDDKQLRLISAISRRTSGPEKLYHSSKLELMAIIWAMNRLRIYLINISFKVVTDCQSLIYLNEKKTTVPQVARWYNFLSEFTFDVIHRPGTKMQHVDALSRAPTEEPTEEDYVEYDGVFTIITREDEVVMYQSQDEDLRRKIEILKKPTKEREGFERSEVEGYELSDGILFKRINDLRKYVVPKAMRKSMAVRHHDLMGHFGLDRTYARMSEYYYFPRMKDYLRQGRAAPRRCVQVYGRWEAYYPSS